MFNTLRIIYEASHLLNTGILSNRIDLKSTIKKIYQSHLLLTRNLFLFIDVRLIRLNVYRFYRIHESLAVRMLHANENSLFFYNDGTSPLNLPFGVFANVDAVHPRLLIPPFRFVVTFTSAPSRWLLRQRTCTFYDKIRFA